MTTKKGGLAHTTLSLLDKLRVAELQRDFWMNKFKHLVDREEFSEYEEALDKFVKTRTKGNET